MAGAAGKLEELLDRMCEAARGNERVSVADVLEVTGRRSFSSVLVVAGLVTLTPIVGDIPGVPTIMGLLVVLTTGQLLAGRDSPWLPGWILRRDVDADSLTGALERIRPVVRAVDGVLNPRLEPLVRDGAATVIAVLCLLVGFAMPAMEFVPFSATGAGTVLTLFGVSLATRDGLVALISFVVLAGGIVLLAATLL